MRCEVIQIFPNHGQPDLACAGGLRFLRFFPGVFSDTLSNRKYWGARNLKFRFCKTRTYTHIFACLFSILGVRWCARAIARLKRQALWPRIEYSNLVWTFIYAPSTLQIWLPGRYLEKPTKSYWLDQLQILIIGTSIYWGYFTVSSQEVSTMALAISFMFTRLKPSLPTHALGWHLPFSHGLWGWV
jgi:hypothetical protein